MENRLSKEEFKSIYSRVPRLCVEAVYYTPEKGVMLTKRAIKPAKGKWHTPGGTVYYKETLENAAKRIAKKELGADISVEKILGVMEAQFYDNYHHDVSIVISVKLLNDRIRLNNNEASEYAFFKTLPEDMIPTQKEFLLNHLDFK
ncbi:NUDIX domain-containing protein [Candidatus Microgenomates bacterium]|nr:NUDIX domain-containing protein [Candidatus Microgenomates bacterium]